jgi:hypothetical protein
MWKTTVFRVIKAKPQCWIGVCVLVWYKDESATIDKGIALKLCLCDLRRIYSCCFDASIFNSVFIDGLNAAC